MAWTILVCVPVFFVTMMIFRGSGNTMCKKKTILYCTGLGVVLLISSLVFMTISCWKGCGPPIHTPGNYITYFPNRLWKDTSPKLVLLWTTNYGFPYWGLPPDYKFEGCPVSNCKITVDQDDFEKSDAVFFHGRTLWNYYLGHKVPQHHPEHQIWGYFDLEPTSHIYLDMKSYNNFFNWTWTYRSDSDIVTAYGKMVRLDNKSMTWETEEDPVLKAAGQVIRNMKQPASGPQLVKHNYRKEKKKVAAWTASNCIFFYSNRQLYMYGYNFMAQLLERQMLMRRKKQWQDKQTQSRRYRAVKELAKHIQVDMFGKCGNKTLKCSNKKKELREECEDELGQYGFYLAFENALCKDYHSEKLWYALGRAQIPIVYGGCDYSKVIPRNSYIDVRDFESTKELAEYIKKVDSDEELYNSYLWWRQYYTVEVYPCSWCEVCSALNDKSRPAQVYSDLDGWLRNDTCQSFSISGGVARVVEGALLFFDLID